MRQPQNFWCFSYRTNFRLEFPHCYNSLCNAPHTHTHTHIYITFMIKNWWKAQTFRVQNVIYSYVKYEILLITVFFFFVEEKLITMSYLSISILIGSKFVGLGGKYLHTIYLSSFLFYFPLTYLSYQTFFLISSLFLTHHFPFFIK